MGEKRDLLKEIAQEVDAFDDMLTALAEILEEKGVLTQQEWEEKIREKMTERQESRNYRDLQFEE